MGVAVIVSVEEADCTLERVGGVDILACILIVYKGVGVLAEVAVEMELLLKVADGLSVPYIVSVPRGLTVAPEVTVATDVSVLALLAVTVGQGLLLAPSAVADGQGLLVVLVLSEGGGVNVAAVETLPIELQDACGVTVPFELSELL